YTVRYHQRETQTILIPLIKNCSNHTRGFTQNLNILNNLQNLDFNTPSDTEESETDDGEPEIANDNMAMQQADVNNLIQAIAAVGERMAIRNNTPMPVFAGGMQDPVEWLEEFERCATINQYPAAYHLQVVGGYLQGEPQVWYHRIANDVANNFQ